MTTSTEQSFKAKIKSLAEDQQLDPAVVWQNLVLERFLIRLAKSKYANQLILKGGSLLSKIVTIGRETKDLDFSMRENLNNKETVREIIEEITLVEVNDGFAFKNIKVDDIPHPHMKYPGVRVSMLGYFGKTRFKVSIDLGYGDFVLPIQFNLPLITSKKGPMFESHVKIVCYPLEFIFAEKLQTILLRKGENSRMKDFHDLYVMVQKHEERPLVNIEEIIKGVFEHRSTEAAFPIVFSKNDLANLQKFWAAHLRGLKANHLMPQEIRMVIDSVNNWLKDKTGLIPTGL